MTRHAIDRAREASRLWALLSRHELTAEGGNLSRRESALVYVVRDREGRRLVVKDGGRSHGGNERAWLSAHASHPGVVDLLGELDGFLVLRWVHGPTLAELPTGAGPHARAAGELLASLQLPPAPDTASLSRRIITAGRRLPAAAAASIQRCHERLAAALAAGTAGDRRHWTYLHADFHPRNLILSSDGLVAIDPFGLAGPPAWDLAQFAAIAYAGAQLGEPPRLSHDAILTQLVAGFGRTPALLEEMAAYWLMLVHRMRRKVGRGPSPWLDSIVGEYSSRAPCRPRRSTSARNRSAQASAPAAEQTHPGGDDHPASPVQLHDTATSRPEPLVHRPDRRPCVTARVRNPPAEARGRENRRSRR